MISRAAIQSILILSWMLGCPAFSRAQNLTPIFESGPRDQRINVVIIAEGFENSEVESFPEKAAGLVDHLFSEDPFKTYKNFFNAYAISVTSNESGADIPSENIEVDTAFDATFESFGIARLLTVNSTKVLDLLNANFPEYDIIMVLVNSTRYGGSGGFVSTASLNSSAFEIAAHEIGHSFGELTDEYETPDANPREAPNATAETNRENVKWDLWFEEETPVPTPETDPWLDRIGLFEGAAYRSEDWYRPHFNSKMRSLDRPWGAVNQEQLTLRIYQSVTLIENPIPKQAFINVSSSEELAFSIEKVFEHTEVQWLLNGEPVAANSLNYSLDPTTLENGIHTVEARVFDTSPFVRNDPFDSLSDPFFWTLQVGISPDVIRFNDWISERLPEDPNQRSPSADPDRDNIDNLAEFFWNTHPGIANSLQTQIRAGHENGALYLDIFREPRPIDLMAYIEAGDNLTSWSSLAKSEFGSPFELEDGFIILPTSSQFATQRIFDDQIPTNHSQRFMRLRLALISEQ